MNFPMRIDFSLGRVRNEKSTESYTSEFLYNIVDRINTKLGYTSSFDTINNLELTTTLTGHESLIHLESSATAHTNKTLSVGFENLTRDKYYLIVDSNLTTWNLESPSLISSSTPLTYNRTVYVFYDIPEKNSIVVLKELKDMYVAEESEGDFESEDFMAWDLSI